MALCKVTSCVTGDAFDGVGTVRDFRRGPSPQPSEDEGLGRYHLGRRRTSGADLEFDCRNVELSRRDRNKVDSSAEHRIASWPHNNSTSWLVVVRRQLCSRQALGLSGRKEAQVVRLRKLIQFSNLGGVPAGDDIFPQSEFGASRTCAATRSSCCSRVRSSAPPDIPFSAPLATSKTNEDQRQGAKTNKGDLFPFAANRLPDVSDGLRGHVGGDKPAAEGSPRGEPLNETEITANEDEQVECCISRPGGSRESPLSAPVRHRDSEEQAEANERGANGTGGQVARAGVENETGDCQEDNDDSKSYQFGYRRRAALEDFLCPHIADVDEEELSHRERVRKQIVAGSRTWRN